MTKKKRRRRRVRVGRVEEISHDLLWVEENTEQIVMRTLFRGARQDVTIELTDVDFARLIRLADIFSDYAERHAKLLTQQQSCVDKALTEAAGG